MMCRFRAAAAIVIFAVRAAAAAEWQPVPGHIFTRWATNVNPQAPLPEYPRPQLQRAAWTNLNGLWDYAVVPVSTSAPAAAAQSEIGNPEPAIPWRGKILVPFPIESALSGVKTNFTPGQQLWYRRTFTAPRLAEGQRLLLQFGAVDWEAQVFVNGRAVGAHRGGYDAFACDITAAVAPGGTNELRVAVTDASSDLQPKGKQKLGSQPVRRSIRYTPVSGIWQTVWMETVPARYIDALRVVPDAGASEVSVECRAAGEGAAGAPVRVTVLDGGQEVAGGEGKAGEALRIKIPQPKLWSPDAPHLYELAIEMGADKVASYFGLRSVALGKDERGGLRPLLNGTFVLQCGVLDQGYWPDGLYTAPTDEALRYDIEMTRRLGFNMARKHVKIEPERWYYWADRLGLLVWQDMPNTRARTGIQRDPQTQRWRDGARVSEEFNTQFEAELTAMVRQRANHPCIVTWVLFNEGWGQYDTPRLTGVIKALDPTRPVNSASGGHEIFCGDWVDLHVYAGPGCPKPEPARAAACGEFGGIALAVPGHKWADAAWGYRGVGDPAALTAAVVDLLNRTWQLCAREGLSAAVYTQLTDVEAECNGLITYDRAVLKVDPAPVADAARGLSAPPAP